jgi:DNA-binding PadR family transcriptional regulator
MPAKRTLPYVILGIIHIQGPQTGKQITHEFIHEIGEFYHASHSQIYPELKRMLKDDWLTSEYLDGKTIRYDITESGKKILKAWMEEESDDDALASLKLYFICVKDDPLLEKILAEQLIKHEEKLSHLKERKAMLFSHDEKKTHYGHYLILTRAIEREENHIKWFKKVQAK